MVGDFASVTAAPNARILWSTAWARCASHVNVCANLMEADACRRQDTAGSARRRFCYSITSHFNSWWNRDDVWTWPKAAVVVIRPLRQLSRAKLPFTAFGASRSTGGDPMAAFGPLFAFDNRHSGHL